MIMYYLYQLVVEWENRYHIQHTRLGQDLRSYQDEHEPCHRIPLQVKFCSYQSSCNTFQQGDLHKQLVLQHRAF